MPRHNEAVDLSWDCPRAVGHHLHEVRGVSTSGSSQETALIPQSMSFAYLPLVAFGLRLRSSCACSCGALVVLVLGWPTSRPLVLDFSYAFWNVWSPLACGSKEKRAAKTTSQSSCSCLRHLSGEVWAVGRASDTEVLKLPVTKIALGVGRNKTTVYKALEESFKIEKRGRPDLLTKQEVNLLVRTIKAMVKKAQGCYEVTLAMVRKRAKVKASERCIREALQKRKFKFRVLRSKPRLTTADVRDRMAFATKYCTKTRAWWRKNVHLFIDLKNFSVYPNAESRTIAAQREVRGAYRQPSQGLDEAYVVAPKGLKYNTGAKAVKIAGGVGMGRVRLWHDVGQKWNASVAAELYSGPVRDALRRACPSKSSFLMLEDNDPTGFKSKLGEKAKAAAKIKVLAIPKRSPDLSVMDYAIWKKVTRTMRAQEKRFPKKKKETRAEFIARLRRTAQNLPKTFIDKAIGNMKERCERLLAAKGHHFEEGGKSKFV